MHAMSHRLRARSSLLLLLLLLLLLTRLLR